MTTPILLDVQALQRPETADRGIGRYVVGLVRAMLDAELPVIGLGLNPALPRPDRLPADLVDSPLWCWTTKPEVRRRVGDRGFIHLVASPLGVADVVTDAVFPPWLSGPGVRRATIVHDLIPYLFPEHYITDVESRRFHDERRAAIVASDLLLTNSERTRSDLIAEWGVDADSVVTIGAPWPHEFATDDPDDRRAVTQREPYVLAPVGYDWRKDPTTLIEGWARLPRPIRRRHRLVLVGEAPDDVREDWVRQGRQAGLKRGELVTTGRVTDAELRDLYGGAALVVHNSRYEGFGLPVVEAAQCGAPSVTSDRGSLPEILDCAGSTFDPDDAASVASVVGRALEEGDFRAQLVAAAIRAATPPDGGDIGTLMVEALSRLGPVEPWQSPRSLLVMGGAASIAESFAASWREIVHLRGSELETSAAVSVAAHDGVVYVLDGSESDVDVLRRAVAFPGLVVCRRATLAPLWIELAEGTTADQPSAVHWLHGVVNRSYRGAHPPSFPTANVLDPAVWERYGLLAFGALLEVSRAVLVEASAFDAVTADAGALASGRLVAVGESELTDVVASLLS